MKIVQAPDEVLSQKAKTVGKIDKSITELIKSMTDTLVNAKDPEGVGLAAPQVGKSLQLFIIKQTPKSPAQIFINPVLKIPEDSTLTHDEPEEKGKKSKKKKPVQLEGCLSLQDIWGVVKRHDSVLLSYMDETGKYHKQKFSGFIATIIQHEYDHLQGVLFPKRVLEQQGKLYKSVKDENGETVFEEIEI